MNHIESRRALKPRQCAGDSLSSKHVEIRHFWRKLVKYALRAEKMAESGLRADSTTHVIIIAKNLAARTALTAQTGSLVSPTRKVMSVN